MRVAGSCGTLKREIIQFRRGNIHEQMPLWWFRNCGLLKLQLCHSSRRTHRVSSPIMPESPHRLSFPTSSEEFALPSTSNTSSTSADDGLPNPLFLRLRRPTLLSKSTYYTDKRMQSPLAISFTVPSRRRGSNGEESESDRERMWSEGSPSSSSGHPTPPITLPVEGDAESNLSTCGIEHCPSTPPPSRSLSTNALATDTLATPGPISRRPTQPVSSMG